MALYNDSSIAAVELLLNTAKNQTDASRLSTDDITRLMWVRWLAEASDKDIQEFRNYMKRGSINPLPDEE